MINVIKNVYKNINIYIYNRMTEVITPLKSRKEYFAKYYQENIKNNETKRQEETERIKTYLKSKYETDPEYKKKKQEYSKNYYNKKMSLKTFN